jgi:hypothetical protein
MGYILKEMKERAGRLFNVYSGEGQQAIIFSLLAFLVSLGASLGLKLSDALFLIHLSASKLPLAYGCISCLMFAIATLIIYALNHYSPSTIFQKVLLVALTFYGAVTCAMLLGVGKTTPWVWFFLRVLNNIVFIEIISCFWTFLDEYYHFQDAKRLYTLFNSAIYLGLACTGFIIQTGALEVVQIYALIFALILVALFLRRKITTTYDIVPDDAEIETAKPPEERSMKGFLKAFLQSRFTLFLMLGSLILFFLMTTTEFGYYTAFQNHFANVPEAPTQDEASFELTRFIGSCLAFVGVANLITGWFVYSRLVLRFGVSNLILLAPIGFTTTYLGWPFDHTLLFPLIGFFVVECMYPVIEDNNFNLLLNGVPLRLKAKVRVVIESFSEPVGMLLTSLLLTFTTIDSKLLGLVLALCAVIVACIIRAQYFKAIFINLSDHALHVHKKASDFLKSLSKKDLKITEDRVLYFLQQDDQEMQMQALDAIFAFGKVNLLKKALAKTDKLSIDAKIHFLTLVENSPFRTETFVIDAINRWQEENRDPKLQGAIDFFLAKIGLLHPERAQYNLASPDLLQRGAAIIALQHSFATLSPQNLTSNRTLALEEIQKLLESKDDEELELGITLLGIEGSQQNIEILINYLRHPSIKIAKAAADALSDLLDAHSMRHAQTILELISQRYDSDFRTLCFQALAKIGHTSLIRPMIKISTSLRPNEARTLEKIIADFGLKAVPQLVGILCDSELSDRSRIVAGKILAALSLPQFNAHLYDVIRQEIERAYFYFYYSQTLPQEYEGNDLTHLKEGLQSSFQSVIDFIIQLLGASKWIEDCELIAFSLRSKRTKIRNQGLETLEMCCDRRIFRLLYPLVSDLPLKEKMNFCLKNTDTEMSITEVLEKMETTPNTLDKILAATWKYRLDLPNWRASLRKHCASQEEIFHHFAYELLET